MYNFVYLKFEPITMLVIATQILIPNLSFQNSPGCYSTLKNMADMSKPPTMEKIFLYYFELPFSFFFRAAQNTKEKYKFKIFQSNFLNINCVCHCRNKWKNRNTKFDPSPNDTGLKKWSSNQTLTLQASSWISKNIKAVRQQGIFYYTMSIVLHCTSVQNTHQLICGWHVAYLRFNACSESLTTHNKHHFHTSKDRLGIP